MSTKKTDRPTPARSKRSRFAVFRTLSAVLVASAAYIGVSQATHAKTSADSDPIEKLWDHATRVDTPESYTAFLAAFSDQPGLQLKARHNMINLMAEFAKEDVDGAALRLASAEKALKNDAAFKSDAGTPYQPPFGKRRWTYSDVYVDAKGQLVNEQGKFISPHGKEVDDPYRVLQHNSLIGSDGGLLAEDVAILPGQLNEGLRRQGIIGRLTMQDRELSNVSNSSVARSAATTVGIGAIQGTLQQGTISETFSSVSTSSTFREADTGPSAGLNGAAATGLYGG